MRLALTIVSPMGRQAADVVLDADPATPIGEIAAEFERLSRVGGGQGTDGQRSGSQGWGGGPGDGGGGRVLRFPGERATGPLAVAEPRGYVPAAPRLYVDYQEVPPRTALADSPVRDGAVVSLGSPEGCVYPEPSGLVEIRVAGGPAAGAVHRLSLGDADIGNGQRAAIPVGDPALPEFALRVRVDSRGGCQVTPHDGVRVLLDREPLGAATQWLPGQQVTVGGTLLGLAPYEPPDAALHRSEDGGGIDFNRPPRLLPPPRVTKFQLPAPPAANERRPLPVLMAVAPVVMGVAMALFMKEPYMLFMSALSPVMLIGNHFTDRKQGRKSHAQRLSEYREHKARIERDAREALDTERGARRAECPDPATVLSIASGPRRRLWERRRTDPDYLLLRAGTADLPSAVELTDPERDEHRRQVFWTVPDAPVTIPLAERGVIGVAGPADAPRAIGRWLLAQAATLHSPNDLQVYVLTDSSGRASWEWVRWLPHCRPGAAKNQGAAGNSAALVGNDAESVAARIAELLAVIAARYKSLRESGATRDPGQLTGQFGTDIVVVFDGSRKLRSLPGTIQILREGPGVGVYAVCLDADERLLPAECQAVVAAGPGGLRVQQMMTDTTDGVRPEQVSPGWCGRLARAIAPIRDVSDEGDTAGLPDSSRLLDVLRLEPPTAEAIGARWSAGGRSTMAMIGESYDGAFGIDIRRDGPHGLIAGTTGSGKSELLQSIVASLAVANRPDEMTFVLVDYKGGSAFADCVRLPHTVGMVTDLDTHLVERALVSLSAELTRREHILAAAGAKDIEDYQILLDRARAGGAGGSGAVPLGQQGQPRQAMPRLLIVIDEFASMVRDLPDFVTGLVNIAQRGRSLGIHLLLATQRPSGVVSADIRANTNLRIALRVTDPAESSDVIDAPEAAQISKSTPGRAYVRLGHASLIPFQAGRVGGRRPGAAADADAMPRPWAAAVEWADLGRPEPARPAARERPQEELTDLKVLVGQVCQAVRRAGLPDQHSPWLPALPHTLLLEDVISGADGRDPGSFGMEDLPSLQAQRPAGVDLGTFSHLMAAGAPRSGRSQLLRAIAGSLALAHSSADLHMYGIDCGNGALLPLTDLPHCGAVVSRTQPERAARLLGRLSAELSRRQEMLAESGFADVNEQRAGAADRLPHIVVFLDRWEGFTTTLGELNSGALTEIVTRILGEGASAGIHLVMTGDRSLLAGRISSLCEEKLVFKMAERDDYGLAGLRPRDMPDEVPAGRAFRAGSGTEIQVALLGPDTSGQGQAAALRSIGSSCAARDASVPPGARPFRVDVLPARISFGEAWALRPASAGPLFGMVGVGGDTLTAMGPDLSSGVPCFIVGGPAKSGKSTILTSMARSFLASSVPVILVAPRPSPLRSLASAPGVARLFDGPDLDAEEFAGALTSLGGPGVVVMDDAEMLRDCDASAELSRLIAFGGDAGRALVFGGDADNICVGFGGWQIDAKRARRGCLIAPSTLPEGDLIGVRLAHGMLGQPTRPGRCLLNAGDGDLITVTVPAPEA